MPFPPLIHLKNSAKFSRWVFWGKSALLKVLLMDVCFMPSFWTESMVLWEYDFTTAEVIESAVAMGLCGRHGFLETRQRLNDRLWRYRISWRFLATQHSEPDFKLEERPACFFFQKVGAGKSLFIYVFWILGGMVKLHGNYILDEMYTQVIYTKAGDHDRQRCRERWVNNT